jgi:cell division protein FtsI (penicillin-binding protein 3)
MSRASRRASRARGRKAAVVTRAWRSALLLACFGVAAVAVQARIVYLQLVDSEFLAAQGNDRHLRTVQLSAHRGSITDRHGEPLAVSTPVDSISANPQQLKPELGRLGELAAALELDPEWVARRITSNLDKEFVYLKRHLVPAQAAEVMQLDIPGVSTLREYRRYHPAGEVAGHVIGFTDIDDRGQEGLEFAYDYWLRGEPGSKRIIQDLHGRVIGDVEQIQAPRPGRDLRASVDLRLQYLAYRELKTAINETGAQWGSVVVLDPATGEVLAIVNQPAYNPNDRLQRDAERYRNRAVTDPIEPGSSFKPFVVAAALESGLYTPTSIVDTGPGYLELKVGGRPLTEDPEPLGRVSLTTVLARSSSVGIAKVALSMQARDIWTVLTALGIGRTTGSGFPGETAGVLNDPQHWREVGQATLSYGYGLSVSTLQLARAYAAVATGGLLPPISFQALDEPPATERVLTEATARQLLGMLEAVVTEGTAGRAAVENYRIAGKTGTARQSQAGGYADDRHTAVFGGIAPVSDPRLVVVVVISEPRGQQYYGGDVAAPVFSRIVSGALRLMAVPPDALAEPPLTIVAQAQVAP